MSKTTKQDDFKFDSSKVKLTYKSRDELKEEFENNPHLKFHLTGRTARKKIIDIKNNIDINGLKKLFPNFRDLKRYVRFYIGDKATAGESMVFDGIHLRVEPNGMFLKMMNIKVDGIQAKEIEGNYGKQTIEIMPDSLEKSIASVSKQMNKKKNN